MKSLVLSVLDKIGITKRSVEGEIIRYGFGDDSYTINTRISLQNEGEIIIYSTSDFKITEECRKRAMEFLNRKNFASKVGCLELDIRDGEVRYRTCLRHGGATDVENIIGAMIGLHHTYFARDIYPKLRLVNDPTNLTSMDELCASAASS